MVAVLRKLTLSAVPTTAAPTPTTTLVTSTKASSTVASSTPVASGTFAKAVGREFNIDGKTGYFAGSNAYWIGFLTDNADVDTVMSHLQTVCIKHS